MTEQEVKRLRRADLLELLVVLSRENDQLREQLAQARAQLADRTIQVENAGSIADAALRLNGVFEAAQNACAQYLENIQEKSRQADDYREELKRRLQSRCGDCGRWRAAFEPENTSEFGMEHNEEESIE